MSGILMQRLGVVGAGGVRLSGGRRGESGQGGRGSVVMAVGA